MLPRVGNARGSGPGGQNVNKVNTKAELWVAVTDIVGMTDRARDRLRQFAGRRLTASDAVHLSSDESRSQEGNRQSVIERLRELIVQSIHEPKARRKDQAVVWLQTTGACQKRNVAVT